MEAAILVVILFFVLFVAGGVYATAKAVGAAKRGVDRTVAQARRTVEDTTLKARQLTLPGAAGEVAQLRLSLRTSMRATQETLRAAAPEDASLGEALGLFDRLSAHGRELDAELKRLENEPDKSRVAACLPGLRERAERIVHSADSLRWAAQDRARQFADDDLGDLTGQIQMEAGALRHWTPAETPGRTPAGGDAGPADAAAPAGPGPVRSHSTGRDSAGRDSAGPDATRPEARPGQSGAPEAPRTPPAITARDSRLRTGFPWEKTRRPESTT
ncbi:hypothetical protein DMH02_017670 [Streptomyces sp. WAC 00631]|uniref:hypothetical protein n=1 Tax=Streptomyces sp. WAC 00631 TaxID=2203201 RepID=UPI000F7B4F0B|nr:hypothetical protein [Streptomyces sp. WAC 00631]MCC5034992.1 hypothetical protein [Streptomyces sp. WAC 00631]